MNLVWCYPDPAGIAALRGAVAEARRGDVRSGTRRLGHRAAMVGRDLPGPGRGPAYTPVVDRPGRPGAGPGLVAAAATDGAPEHPAPEGDVALSLSLVRRAQTGDAGAFGELYDRYVDQVYRYVYFRVPSQHLAEDLTSETFLRALRRISSFTWQGRDVGAWFVTIARNLIADHYKSGRYRLELSTDDVTTAGTAPTVDGPEGAVLASMQNTVLLETVKQLGAEQQECIVLRFLQGLSVAETAQVMGKNEGAIKALQYRATRTLGRLLPDGVEL